MLEKNHIGKYTYRLFRRSSFVEGVGSLLDFRKNIERYGTDDTNDTADAKSLESDWRAVGDDFDTAIRCYEQEHSGKQELAIAR